ncbi:hypothetical protein PCE1_001149 [Barthelona sp. PCE]
MQTKSEFFKRASEYATTNNLNQLLNECYSELITSQPSDHLVHLRDYLKRNPVLRIIISGPPAAGKGTQSEEIVEEFGVVHISTGAILRREIRNKTELGKIADSHISNGNYVPDDIICGIVINRLSEPDCLEKGWLLDGFPRNRAQAIFLQTSGCLANKFINIVVDDDVLVERALGRMMDPTDGHIYHLKFSPPPKEILSRLIHRKDDTEAAMRTRLGLYHRNMRGIRCLYKSLEFQVDGAKHPDEIYEDIRKYLRTNAQLPREVKRKQASIFVCGPTTLGKTSQAWKLSEILTVPYVNIGMLLRHFDHETTDLLAKHHVSSDVLVPMFLEYVHEHNGVPLVVDGFPRNKTDVEHLQKAGFVMDRLVYLESKHDDVAFRAENRYFEYGVAKFKDTEDEFPEGVVRSPLDAPEVCEQIYANAEEMVAEAERLFPRNVLKVDATLPFDAITQQVLYFRDTAV